jgi:hypothetical protein
MRREVLNAAAVPELAAVVPLAIDTERAENDAFLRDFPVGVWPTFYLIDPTTRAVRGRWLGAASPAQLQQWLKDSARADSKAAALLRQAEELSAKKNHVDAATSYRAALAEAPPDWPGRPAALVALSSALLKQRDYDGCLELARTEAQKLPASVSAVDFASVSASCADRAQDPQAARAVRLLLEASLVRSCEAAAPGASADDQADACDNLRRVREALGDRAGAERAAEQALGAIKRATSGVSPETELIHDWLRTTNLAYLSRSQEAISLLLERERAVPLSYNPPHYLARLYRDLRQWPEGLAAIERAIAKAYGPRRAGFLGLKAELLQGAGRTDEARRVLEQQLAEYRALPPSQRQPDAEAAVEKRLTSFGSRSP